MGPGHGIGVPHAVAAKAPAPGPHGPRAPRPEQWVLVQCAACNAVCGRLRRLVEVGCVCFVFLIYYVFMFNTITNIISK